ncbi:hypothetical protein V6N13_043338 [Hibiscus sabdariffa]
MVKDTVTASGVWEWARLAVVLPFVALDHIATVPPPRLSFDSDTPGWRWTDNRQFTIQSAYRFLVDIIDSPSDGIWKNFGRYRSLSGCIPFCGFPFINDIWRMQKGFAGISHLLICAPFATSVWKI